MLMSPSIEGRAAQQCCQPGSPMRSQLHASVVHYHCQHRLLCATMLSTSHDACFATLATC